MGDAESFPGLNLTSRKHLEKNKNKTCGAANTNYLSREESKLGTRGRGKVRRQNQELQKTIPREE